MAFTNHTGLFLPLESIVRTGHGTIPAADAFLLVMYHYPVLISLLQGIGRTTLDTGWILTVIAGYGEIKGMMIALAGRQLVEGAPE
jgi:hypothetical protein